MGKFVDINNKDVVKYEALVKKSFNKLFALEQHLTFYKINFCGQIKTSEIFYDTPNDILYKAGIIISKIQEENRVYFKVRQTSQHKKLNSSHKVFAHKIGLKDTLKDHAFYLVDGIRGVFTTPIYIDLEHIIQNAVPKVATFTTSNVYKVISGSGFRAFMGMEETKYKNFETKINKQVEGLIVKLDGPDQYLPEFEDFNNSIKKYCKEFVEVNDHIYEHIKKVTRKIDSKQVKQDIKKAKAEIANKNNK